MEVNLQLVNDVPGVHANNANQKSDAQVDIRVVLNVAQSLDIEFNRQNLCQDAGNQIRQVIHVLVDVVKDAKGDKQ